MTTGQQFTAGIFAALKQAGFSGTGNLRRVIGEGGTVLVGVEKGFGDQWFVNAGICLDSLGSEQIERIERSHMYFRLERLFPQYRELILASGQLDDPEQAIAYGELIGLLANDIALGLKQLASARGAAEAYRAGRLEGGLVTKAARELLSSSV
jgi:hypothetical protein